MSIPARPSESTIRRYATNIVAVYGSASQDQISRGTQWYRVAHDIAAMIGETVEQGAAVIAILSARNSWERNVKIATDAIATGEPKGHTKANLDKVRRVLNGEDPESVLPMTLKTGHFYRCIVNPDDPDAVVIDRHAHDVAVGRRYSEREDRGLSSQSRYDSLAKAYRIASRRLNVSPATVQAVTWCVQVDSNNNRK